MYLVIGTDTSGEIFINRHTDQMDAKYVSKFLTAEGGFVPDMILLIESGTSHPVLRLKWVKGKDY